MALVENFILVWKGLQRTNATAYIGSTLVTKKSFLTFPPDYDLPAVRQLPHQLPERGSRVCGEPLLAIIWIVLNRRKTKTEREREREKERG